MTRWIIGLLLVVAGTVPAEVSLPLDGYYREGRYMPVKVGGGGATVWAENTVETRSEPGSGGVAPLLVVGRCRQVRWKAGGSGGFVEKPLTPLAPDQRLVGFAQIDMAVARQMFPDLTVLPLKVDVGAVMGSPAAFNTLDGVVLPSAALVNDQVVGRVVAGGISVAVRSPSKPAGNLPWRQAGSYWIVRATEVGPTRAGVDAAAMTGAQGWRAEWPKPFRVRLMLYAVMSAVVMLIVSLWRSRWGVVVALVVGLGAAGAIHAWGRGRSPVLARSGEVAVAWDWPVRDRWTYQASPTAAKASFPWDGAMTMPFLEMKAWKEMSFALVCDGDGRPKRFEYVSLPGISIGFLSRSVGEPFPGNGRLDALHPLRRLAERAYEQGEWKVTGWQQADGGATMSREAWGVIGVKRE